MILWAWIFLIAFSAVCIWMAIKGYDQWEIHEERQQTKMWKENGQIKCCSQLCRQINCPRFDKCEDAFVSVIRVKNKKRSGGK
jgi:hypothetical protein